MISVPEADRAILENLPDFPAVSCPVEQALERRLAEDLQAERAIPPYHRVMMDGIALVSKVWKSGVKTFPILGTAQAGQVQQALSEETGCFRVMTGAMLPEGADAVIPVEDLTLTKDAAEVTGSPTVHPMRYVHQQGSDNPEGAPLLKAGTVLNAAHLAVAAAAGCSTLKVTRRPSVAVISNGDEIVDLDQPVEQHQIRPSNAYAMRAALIGRGFSEVERFHYGDHQDEIEQGLARQLSDFDALILSGGVSVGDFDFLPRVLNKLGVREVFHKVRQRPGKPFWFGVAPSGQPVFALPGNPVSTLVCFHRYVLPALGAVRRKPIPVELAEPLVFEAKMTYFSPVALDEGKARPVPFNTSGDYLSLARTDGFVECPEEKVRMEAGSKLMYRDWSG